MRLSCTLAAGLLFLGASALTQNDNNKVHTTNDTELICHTSDPSECYPKIFVPKEYFQVVHDDQAIPKGLHVRVDMQTGQKEAKLYDPATDTEPGNAVEVLPDEPLRDEPLDSGSSDVQRQAQQVVEEMRKAKASKGETLKPPVGSAGDREMFNKNLKVIEDYLRTDTSAEHSPSTAAVLEALEELEELCHDVYWGHELIKAEEGDPGTPLRSRSPLRIVRILDRGSPDVKSLFIRLLATSLRNNAAALDQFELLSSPPGFPEPMYTFHINHLIDMFEDYDENENEWDPLAVSRAISLFSAILPREPFSRHFYEAGGLKALHGAVELQNKRASGNDNDRKEFDRLISKLENFLTDHYLNEDGRAMIEALSKEVDSKIKAEGEFVSWDTNHFRLRSWCEELDAGNQMLHADWYTKDHGAPKESWFQADICDDWKELQPKGGNMGEKSEL